MEPINAPADLSTEQERLLRETIIEPFSIGRAEDEINLTESDFEDVEPPKPVGRWLSLRELGELRGEEFNEIEHEALPIQARDDDEAFAPFLGKVQPIVGAFPMPDYYTLTNTTFATNELFDPLRARIQEVFNNRGVEVEKSNNYFFKCCVEVEGEVISFDLTIMREKEDQGAVKNLVEVRHTYGCRFKYGEFSDELANDLNVVYIGYVKGCRGLSSTPPPLPPGLFPEIELSPEDIKMNNAVIVAEVLERLSFERQTSEGMINALQATYNYKNPVHFGPGGIAIPLADRTAEIFLTYAPEDLEVRCAAMATLAKIAAYPGLDPPLQIRILHIVLNGLHDPSLLIKMNALKVLTGIVNSVDQVEHHENREGVNFFLKMPEMQFLLAQEVFSRSRPCIDMARKLCERK